MDEYGHELNITLRPHLLLSKHAPAVSVVVHECAPLTDKEFAEEATKAFSFVPEFVAGPDTSARVRQMLSTSPELRRQVSDYVKAGAGVK
jgi:hypothetical protein